MGSRLRVGGIVLCGGQSSRMGRPKASLPFGDELMLPRVVRLLSEVVAPVVVVAAPRQKVPALPEGVAIVRDAQKGRGPLQGLLTGLQALSGRADAAYLSSCDVPFLKPAFVRRLITLLGDHAICVPHVGDYHHPLAAVYRLDVAEAVDRLLKQDRLRPVFLFETVPTRIVEAGELADVNPAFQTLRNLNRPEEYKLALKQLSMPVEAIISGGQTGVDRAALDAALELGIPCGGWCPRGRRAEDGPIPDRYPLHETSTDAYPQRTERNVRDSDGTLILTRGMPDRGTALTRNLARKHKKPCKFVNLSRPPLPEAVRTWIESHPIRILNVAGPRESSQPGIGARARQFLLAVLSDEGCNSG